MKVAFIADPLAGFKTYKDSTFAMMEAAAARGHQLFAGLPDLFAREGRVYLRAAPLTPDRPAGRLVPLRYAAGHRPHRL